MTQFQLKISSSSGLFYEGTCESLVVPTSDGEYGVLANHVSMVIGIAIGILRYKMDGKWYYVAVGQGFARVVGNTVTMVVDSAERPEDVDAKRAQEAKERAEERIALQTRVLSRSNGNGQSYDAVENQRKEIHVIILMK